jgi:hypothetical protein
MDYSKANKYKYLSCQFSIILSLSPLSILFPEVIQLSNQPCGLMVTVSILVVGIVTAINFGAMSAQAQTTMHGNQTTNGKTMAGNTTGNMRKGNSTSMPTPEGPPAP